MRTPNAPIKNSTMLSTIYGSVPIGFIVYILPQLLGSFIVCTAGQLRQVIAT